jgi:hypothetical protein
MENSCEIMPHPNFLDALFVFRSKVSNVFSDVLGLYELNHIAVTRISPKRDILTFSSTPAMEFNLFNSNLWRFDKTYHPDWFRTCSQSNWPSLYMPERFDELYYLKQTKHHYPIGYSLATQLEDNFFIYSLASNRSCDHTRELFANQHGEFYKIGQYCSNLLGHLFKAVDRKEFI